MTIACCFVVPEGIVLGTDSTITTEIDGKPHYLNHNQKVFEVGEDSQFGMITWGLTSFGDTSYRSLIARLADQFEKSPPPSVLDAANIWSDLVWRAYQTSFASQIARFRELENEISSSEEPHTKAEKRADEAGKNELKYIYNAYKVGFCLAGYVKRDRFPRAYEIELNPRLRSQPPAYNIDRLKHFGKNDVVSRIIGVFDE